MKKPKIEVDKVLKTAMEKKRIVLAKYRKSCHPEFISGTCFGISEHPQRERNLNEK